MREMSNADYDRTLRLLRFLSNTKGESLREKEASEESKVVNRKIREKMKISEYKKAFSDLFDKMEREHGECTMVTITHADSFLEESGVPYVETTDVAIEF